MKINLVSDLHMEAWPDFNVYDPTHLFPGGDVLILAGDIFVAKHLARLNNEASSIFKKALSIHWFIEELCYKYDHVIMVMGNHEHYQGTFEKTAGIIRDNLSALDNFHLLDNESLEIEGITFYGGTLWTNAPRNPLYAYHIENLMNDYRTIKTNKNGYRRLRAIDTLGEHNKFMDGLRKAAEKAKRLVVIGHHAPSSKSLDPRFANAGLDNLAYYSDLDMYMEEYKPELWVHGHMHSPCDYTVGETRVVANPFGYYGYEVYFKQLFIKEIEL